MSHIIRESKDVDILLIGEGTYPYIQGGVSSWIHQLINGMPELNFGIVFLGSKAEEYGDVRYTLPDNLTHLEVHYLFTESDNTTAKRQKDSDDFKAIEELYQWFKSSEGDIPQNIKDISFYTEKITHKHFLHSKQSWDFITKKYMENAPDIPFIDYFWTVKNIHKPIWVLANIVKNMPKCKVIHSPSTGYAGFLGSLASFNTNTPFLLTEHGIYTRERKIDMLTADWISFQKPTLLKQAEEFNYIKKMWVNFFEQIGLFSYKRAEKIFSLYAGARTIQIEFGAEEKKCFVVPNGVDVDGLREAYLAREEGIPKVITLIGRVVSIKDIKTFIRAIRIVANEIEDIQAWVVGPLDEDPTYAEECQYMVETLNLQNNFFFKGFQNIKDILPKTGLLTITSVSEGMPLTILEGFAAGVPCIATDVGSCRDLIYGGLGEEDVAMGKAGEITSIANPSALAESYIRFLSDESLWKAAQKTALTRVQAYYRQDTFLETYRNIYSEVM